MLCCRQQILKLWAIYVQILMIKTLLYLFFNNTTQFTQVNNETSVWINLTSNSNF